MKNKKSLSRAFQEKLERLDAEELFEELRRSDVLLKRARTHQIRFKMRTEKSQLVRMEDAEASWKLTVSAVRERLLALPPTIAHAIVGLTGLPHMLPEFERMLKVHIYEAMEVLADILVEVHDSSKTPETKEVTK